MKKKEEKKPSGDNSFGVAGVVLGVFSIASLSFVGIILGIVGLVFSLRQGKINRNRWSKAGIILNIAGVILGIAAIVFLVIYAPNSLAELQNL